MPSLLDQLLRDAPEWHDRAACGDSAAAEIFLQTLNGGRRAVPAAIEICRRCPVRVECGDHARASGERLGVWGGLNYGDETRAVFEWVAQPGRQQQPKGG